MAPRSSRQSRSSSSLRTRRTANRKQIRNSLRSQYETLHLEQLESRLLLASDLIYPGASTAFDYTLTVQSGGAAPVVRLAETVSDTTVVTAILSVAGDTTLNVRASDQKDVRGDRLNIDLNSLNLLNTFVANNGGSFTINFDGGLDITTGLPLPVFDDSVFLNGTGSYSIGYSLIVTSSSDITLAPGNATFTGSFTARSAATASGQGDATDPTKFIAIPDTSITMTSGRIAATNITLQSQSVVNVQINTSTALGSSVRFGTTVAMSSADIELSGTAQLAASGALVIDAVSTVNTTLQRRPQADGNAADDSTSDAAIAASIVDSDAGIHIGGTAAITAGGLATITANNTNTVITTADGLGGSADAGGTLATTVVSGDTSLLVDGTASIISTGNLLLQSRSNRTLTTTSIATPKGARDDGNAGTQTQGQQALANNDASTSDGAMRLAAAIGVSTLSGDTTAAIRGGAATGPTVRSTSGTLTLLSDASHNVTINADSTTTTGSGDGGVGVGAAINALFADSAATLSGTSTLGGSTITVDGRVTSGLSTIDAKSGRSGGSASNSDIGVAGSFAVGIHDVNASATLASDAKVTLSNNHLTLTSINNTTETTRALPLEGAGGQSLGVGASYALGVADHTTRAALDNGALVTGVNNLTLSSTAVNNVTTRAKAGAAGGVSIAGAVAHTIANEDTLATLGSGTATAVAGNLSLLADHRGIHDTQANGDSVSSGSVAIAGVFALSNVNVQTTTTTLRDLNVTGTLSMIASDGTSSSNSGTASAGGNDNEGGNADAQTSNQRNAGNTRTSNRNVSGRTARNSSTQGANPSAASSDGPVAIAASLSLNMVTSAVSATLPSGRSIVVGQTSTIRALGNVDGSANADAAAVGSGAVGIGAAAAINSITSTIDASIAGSTTLSTRGLTLEAMMRNISGDVTQTTSADATSGSGSTNVGIAGSVALNLILASSVATVQPNANLIGLNSQNINVRSENRTNARAKTKPKSGGAGDVGIGGSLALNRLDNTSTATIANSAPLVGTPVSLTIDATAAHVATTESENGAAGNVGIGAAVALSLINNQTHARLGTGAAIAFASAATIQANHSSAINTKAHATTAGSSVGVGVSVGIADANESSSATLARDLTLGAALTLTSTSNVSSIIDANASVKGNSSTGRSADNEANRQRNLTPNRGSNASLPNINDLMSSGSSSSQSNSSTNSSGVNVPASLAINLHDAINRAAIESGADVTTTGSITVSTIGHSDAITKAVGTSVTLTESSNIGAGVGLTFATFENRVNVSTGSIVKGNGVTLEAITPPGQNNDYVTWGAAAGGGRGDVGIAGSVGITYLTNFNTVETAAGSHIKSTGNMTLNAEQRVNPQTVAAGAGFSSSVAVGAAVAITNLHITTTALVLGNADAGGAMNITSRTTIAPTKVDLPLLSGAQDPTANSVAAAGGVSSGNVGVAGAVGISDYTLVTQAAIGAGSQINRAVDITALGSQSLTVRAEDLTSITSFAGSLGASFGSVGVGAGLDLNMLHKDTRAFIAAGSHVSTTTNITIAATNTDDLDSISANAGGGNSVGIAGSAAIYVLDTGARAYVDSNAAQSTTANVGGAMSVTATGNLSMNTIAASVGFGGTAGVGAGNVTLTHTDSVQAWIGNNSQITVAGGTGLTVNATSREDIVGVTASGAGAGTAAVAARLRLSC